MNESPHDKLAELLKDLSPSHAERMLELVEAIRAPIAVERTTDSDFASEVFVRAMGDFLLFHHALSTAPFTKDKFEHAMVSALGVSSRKAELARRGNPGHDLTVDGVPWSLKTQADRGIKREYVYISKFMELGKGAWTRAADLAGLRDQFFAHMNAYERIIVLRYLSGNPANQRDFKHEYQLIEIPKALLLRAAGGKLRMQQDSTQRPKPGYCEVTDLLGNLEFCLYFDGGSERKLQIKNIRVQSCLLHASWSFGTP